jgi:hypothetical protein
MDHPSPPRSEVAHPGVHPTPDGAALAAPAGNNGGGAAPTLLVHDPSTVWHARATGGAGQSGDGGARPGTWRQAPATPRRLLEVLPAAFADTRPPLLYRMVKEAEQGHAPARIARSATYHANAFSCGFFYKAISRCIQWEPPR